MNIIKECCLKKKEKIDIKELILKDKINKECLICLESFNKQETVIQLKCDHYYHTQCIYKWFEKKKTCPLCDEILKIS